MEKPEEFVMWFTHRSAIVRPKKPDDTAARLKAWRELVNRLISIDN